MLRLSALAIALTLGIGPNASILCHTWCAGDNLPQECHQNLASATVAAADCCDSRVTHLNAVRSGASLQDTVSPDQEAGAVRHHADVPAAFVRLSLRYPRGSNENCLVTVLRI